VKGGAREQLETVYGDAAPRNLVRWWWCQRFLTELVESASTTWNTRFVEVLVLRLLGAALIGVVDCELELKSVNNIALDVPAKPVELANVDWTWTYELNAVEDLAPESPNMVEEVTPSTPAKDWEEVGANKFQEVVWGFDADGGGDIWPKDVDELEITAMLPELANGPDTTGDWDDIAFDGHEENTDEELVVAEGLGEGANWVEDIVPAALNDARISPELWLGNPDVDKAELGWLDGAEGMFELSARLDDTTTIEVAPAWPEKAAWLLELSIWLDDTTVEETATAWLSDPTFEDVIPAWSEDAGSVLEPWLDKTVVDEAASAWPDDVVLIELCTWLFDIWDEECVLTTWLDDAATLLEPPSWLEDATRLLEVSAVLDNWVATNWLEVAAVLFELFAWLDDCAKITWPEDVAIWFELLGRLDDCAETALLKEVTAVFERFGKLDDCATLLGLDDVATLLALSAWLENCPELDWLEEDKWLLPPTVVLRRTDRPSDPAVHSKVDEPRASATVLELSTLVVDMETDDGTTPMPLEMTSWLVVNWLEELDSVVILLELSMVVEEEIPLAWAADLDDAALLLEEVAPRLLTRVEELGDPVTLLEELGGSLVLLELPIWDGEEGLHDCAEELAAAAIVEKLDGFAELKDWLAIWVDDIGVSKLLEPKFEPVVLMSPCETIVLLDKVDEVDEVETPGTVTLKECVPIVRVWVWDKLVNGMDTIRLYTSAKFGPSIVELSGLYPPQNSEPFPTQGWLQWDTSTAAPPMYSGK
jgi:hypothetical protein